MKSFKKHLIRNAAQIGDENACLWQTPGKGLSTVAWKEFYDDINAMGTAMNAGNINGNIFILGENSYQWLLVYLSAVCGSGVAIALDSAQPVEMLRAQIELLGNSGGFVFYSEAYREPAEELAKTLPNHRFINIDGGEFDRLKKKGYSMIAVGDRTFIDAETDENTCVAMLFTSGTTGVKKAAMYSNKNICADCEGGNTLMRFSPGGRALLLPPLSSLYGCSSTFSVIVGGGTICITPSFKRLSEQVRVMRATQLIAFPSAVMTILGELKASGFTGKNAAEHFFGFPIDWIISGGAPLPSKTISELDELGIITVGGYGMTETRIVSCGPPDAPRLGSDGRVIPGCEVRIAPDGEVLVKGDGVMLGYYNNPTEQEKIIQDGWLMTGDLGTLDDDGFLFIKGRKKNMILLANGKNVYPEVLEERLLGIEGVKEALVYQQEGSIVAEIYAPGYEQQAEAGTGKLNSSSPSYERFQRVIVRDRPFEKSNTQKILRK